MQLDLKELGHVGAIGVALVMLFAGACVSSSARSAGPRMHDALRAGYENSQAGRNVERQPYTAVLDGAG